MSPTKPRTMRGVMELLPADQIAFVRMLDTIRAGFERYGFVPVETPAIEISDVLLTKSGGDTEKQVYWVQSTGAREQGKAPDLALRFDLTVPLARYVAEHEGKLTFPFRRYQMQRVYRGERAQRGRYREFYQCDVDVIGKGELDPRHDADIAAVMIDVFERLEIGAFTVRMSNRKILRGLLGSLGVADDKLGDVLREVDKLDKRGPDYLREQLAGDAFAMPSDAIDRVLSFVAAGEGREPREVLAEIDGAAEGSELFAAGVAELTAVVDALEGLGVPADRYCVDLSIARGLDYYTGTVYETFLDDHPDIGSICSGGRYDDLATHYTTSVLPGVGMSIGATRLFFQLRELGLVGDGAAITQVVVTDQDPALRGECLAIAAQLRRADVRTEIILDSWKFKKQMKYVANTGARLAIIVGADEHAAGTATVRNMRTRDQVQVARADLLAHVQAQLGTE